MGFDPLTMMVVGTGLKAVSSIAGGIGQERAGKVNAANKEAMAASTESQTAANVGAHRREFAKFRGAMRSDLAAYGGSSKRGTGLLLAQEAERQGKLDELNIIVQGTNEAKGLRAGASMDRWQGKVAKTQGILGGLGQAVSGYNSWQAGQS